MASGLPPPPINDKPGSFTWLEWYRQLRNYVSTTGSVPWYIINFSGSNITDIAQRAHNNLQNLQGGSSGQMYHLNSAEYSNAKHTIEYVTPLTGFTNTIADTTANYIIEPAGTLATGSLTMPASPQNEQIVTITSTQTITALTHTGNTGQTLNGALTTISVNGFASWIYRSTNKTWYRIN